MCRNVEKKVKKDDLAEYIPLFNYFSMLKLYSTGLLCMYLFIVTLKLIIMLWKTIYPQFT